MTITPVGQFTSLPAKNLHDKGSICCHSLVTLYDAIRGCLAYVQAASLREEIAPHNQADSAICLSYLPSRHFPCPPSCCQAWKAVGESGEKPLEYYQNNVVSTLNLLQAMRKHRVRNFVYSSSATVYGEPDKTPIPETAAFRMESPYSRTKVFCEYILMDMAKADPELNVCTLRYFK